MAISYTYKPPALAPLPPAPSSKLYGFDNRPGLAAENDLLRQIETQPALYKPVRDARKAALKDAMAGYGSAFSFKQDDPATPIDESLGLDYDENAPPGEVYRAPIRNIRNRAAAKGLLYSSFADRDIGAEAARISAVAKEMVQKYAADMDASASDEWQNTNQLRGQLLTKYGEDSAWLAQQAPPKIANVGSRPDGLFNWGEWAKYQVKAGRPSTYITPENFWAYIAKHGGAVNNANASKEAA